MPFLYFKHIIYKIFGETSLKNVNSRDSYRFFWQFDSQNLILDTRSSVTGNFKIKEYKKKQEKRECKKRLQELSGVSGFPYLSQEALLSYQVIGKHG